MIAWDIVTIGFMGFIFFGFISIMSVFDSGAFDDKWGAFRFIIVLVFGLLSFCSLFACAYQIYKGLY